MQICCAFVFDRQAYNLIRYDGRTHCVYLKACISANGHFVILAWAATQIGRQEAGTLWEPKVLLKIVHFFILKKRPQ